MQKAGSSVAYICQPKSVALIGASANAAEEAGNLIGDLPKLWAGDNLEERRKLLVTMLDAVYIDSKQTKSIA